MLIKVPSAGPKPAKILIVGETPGKSDEEQIKPFVGSAGFELTKMLNDAGILRSECRVTYVCKYRPPANNIEYWWPQKKKDFKPSHKAYDGQHLDERIIEGLKELEQEIEETKPNVIIPLGNLALWATTRNTGILRWRSSLLKYHKDPTIKVIPTISPAAVLRNWEWRYLAVHDLKRAKRWMDVDGYPKLEFDLHVEPSFEETLHTLNVLLSTAKSEGLELAVDIETRNRKIACIGMAWSAREALCIPFIVNSGDGNYFSNPEEELRVILLLRELLSHPQVKVDGQNWQYDGQYLAKYWGFEVSLDLDIMSEHHVQFPGLPKGLDFQSSLYCDIHIYWKDEGKEQGGGDDRQWWTYNCLDCVRTFEIATVLRAARNSSRLKTTIYGSPHTIQQRLSTPILRASMRGVRLDHKLRNATAFECGERRAERETWINSILGREFNCRSPKQMHALFYEELGLAKILDRKTHKPTCNEKALSTFGRNDVLLRPLTSAINQVRSLSNFEAVCRQPLDADGRLRCQYNIPGAETYRFASSSDPFGYGTNLQNLTSGDETDQDFPLPNLRKCIIPDVGYTIGEFDLAQADARVVAWEAEDETLISIFEDSSRDLHNENCETIFGSRPTSKHDIRRYYAKQGVHLTNYGGTADVLAKTLGITRKEADHFQSRWFGAHPKILKWHQRVQMQLQLHRFVENKFGYRRFYFDRVDGLLKEALAWIPQSTVAIATNLGILAVEDDPLFKKLLVQLLLQVHDSSVWQWPTIDTDKILPLMESKLTITVPYAKPLIFTAKGKLSSKSWGDCE